MKKTTYNQSPLPFQGQKRRFLKSLKEILPDFSDTAIYIDLFGGSGLLAHNVKQFKPNAQVIYNDFDNYYSRISSIATTNKLLYKIRSIVKDYPKDRRLPNEVKTAILEIVREVATNEPVDYITLSSSLLFSGNYETDYPGFEKQHFYNVVKQSDYNADGYLQGVQRVSTDYRALFNKYKTNKEVVWLVDPPYLSTDTKTYNSDGYWKLKDYLDVLQVLEKHPYIYFTSNKSSIVELCEWIATKVPGANPFKDAQLKTVNVSMNYCSSYTDMMYYKYTNHS